MPVILVTPPSFPANDNSSTFSDDSEPPGSNRALLTPVNDVSLGSSLAAFLPSADCPTDVAEIGLAYSTYQKVALL